MVSKLPMQEIRFPLCLLQISTQVNVVLLEVHLLKDTFSKPDCTVSIGKDTGRKEQGVNGAYAWRKLKKHEKPWSFNFLAPEFYI